MTTNTKRTPDPMQIVRDHFEWLVEHDQHTDADLLMLEVVRKAMTTPAAHVARIAELEAALLVVERQCAVLSDSIHLYPRPSHDPHGRILLDCYEMAKACARTARAALKGKA